MTSIQDNDFYQNNNLKEEKIASKNKLAKLLHPELKQKLEINSNLNRLT